MSNKKRRPKPASRAARRRPDRQAVVSELEKLGGREEVERFDRVEKMEFKHGNDTVLHYYKLGQELSPTWVKYEKNGLRLYAIGLNRNIDLLRAAVRMSDIWSEHEVSSIIADSQRKEHELTWSHFRRLINEKLTDAQRDNLIKRSVAERWHYRDLESHIQDIVGKRSQGGRRVSRPKSFRGSIGAMVQRSKAWLALEDGWADELKDFVKKLPESEKYTRATLNSACEVAATLQQVKDRATADYDAAQKLVDDINDRLDRPALVQEDDAGREPGRVKVAPRKSGKKGRRLAAAAR